MSGTTMFETLEELCNAYLDALLNADRHTANEMILDAVADGTSIREIYLHVFQASQYKIGRLWQQNQVTVAQEHFCTAATQTIMAQFYPQIFNVPRVGHRMIATSVSGELHEIGMRMVADFFEMDGWDTYYIGANSPISATLAAIDEQKADILCVSATMYFHVSRVKAVIDAVRETDAGQTMKILVGGYAFLKEEKLWQTVGADGFGRDATEAIALANKLMQKSSL